MKTLATLLILAVFMAGCATTQQPESAPLTTNVQPQPTTNQQAVPAVFECMDNSQCPEGQSCISNSCVRIQFVK